ncbi:MAG TPA: hypothetical protein VM144_04855 [Aestuariivirga sp.]|nr:hypothetical protein [Aestuariivirga sp.]
MRGFSKISPELWDSERFNTLPSDDGRYLYLYLLTCSHQTSAGAYKLPDGYAATDLRWTPERYFIAREVLVGADLIRFDPQTSVVLITRWFKHNPPMNADHLKSIEGELERLSSPTLAQEAHSDLLMIQESLEAEKAAKAARRQKPVHGVPNGFGGPMPERLNTNYLTSKR